MSPIEKAYQDFKNSKNQTKIINGKLYYQIIWSDYIDLKSREHGVLSIIPSPNMPINKEFVYKDENGNHFTFGGFHFIRFVGEIPEWYLKCGECSMKWQETKDIGNYLTILE